MQISLGKAHCVILQVSLPELLWKAFDDSTIIILLVAGTLSLGLGVALPTPGGGGNDWVEGAAILAAVAVVVGVSAGNNYQKEKQFRELSSLSEESEVLLSSLYARVTPTVQPLRGSAAGQRCVR